MAKAVRKTSGGRGSAEAIEKRRVARQVNTLLGGGPSGGKLDGRTEKRRQRLLQELRDGKRGQPLKPIEVVSRADELLQLGETLTSIRKNGVKAPKVELGSDDDRADAVLRAQEVYGFDPEAWKLLGIDLERLGARPAKTNTARKAKR